MGSENLASVAWPSAMAASTTGLAVHVPKSCSPKPLSQPATTAMNVRMHSGTVISLGDSWGWPWPRYSP